MSGAVKKTLGVIIIAAVMAGAAFVTLDGLLASGSGATGRVAALLHLKNETVSVADQVQSDALVVRLAALKSPGFVAIYDDEEGPGKLLGTSRLLPAGVTRDAVVPLQRPPAAGYYYAMLRLDDGDGAFAPNADQAARDARGVIVMTRFLISAGE